MLWSNLINCIQQNYKTAKNIALAIVEKYYQGILTLIKSKETSLTIC